MQYLHQEEFDQLIELCEALCLVSLSVV